MADWRKLWSKALDNTFLASDNNAWIILSKLMLLANGNGEYVTSTRNFAQRVGLSHSACVRTLDRLQAENIITKAATVRGKNTILKFRNWRRYQGSSQRVKQQPEQQPEQQTTDDFMQNTEQIVEQQAAQKRNRSGTEDQNLQGSKKPLDIDNRINTHTARENAKKIVQFYNQVFNTEILELPERLKQIEIRLRTFTARDIAVAIKHASQDDFFNGGGSSGWIGSLDYLVKNNKNLEKYLNLTPKPRKKYA